MCLANVKFLVLFNFKLPAKPKKATKPKSPKKAAKKAGAKKGKPVFLHIKKINRL